jgi:hypothetical protein
MRMFSRVDLNMRGGDNYATGTKALRAVGRTL